jgi:FAD/FMN-containing dehydrogenase
MADCAENRSSRSTMVFVQHLGDAVRRIRTDETAFAIRDAAFVMNVMGDWRDARETPRHVEWIREAWKRLSPHSTGAVYLNYLGREERDAESLAQASYGANYDRLVQIKAKYDPTNLFRLNHTFKGIN